MQKIAIDLGFRPLYWYGILVAVGFLVGLWTASRRGVRYGLAPNTVFDLGPWLILGGIGGARAMFVVTYWDEFFAGKPFWEVFMIQKGGQVYYGGLIGAAVITAIWLRIKRVPVRELADVLAPSIALGQAFGRVGCLMNGCCFGKPCDLPWSIHFPPGHEMAGIGVHPTQIYAALMSLGLYAGLAWWYRRRHFKGQVFALYLLLYACLRFGLEHFRGDYTFHHLGGRLTPGELISLGILVVGILVYAYCRASGARSKQPNQMDSRS